MYLNNSVNKEILTRQEGKLIIQMAFLPSLTGETIYWSENDNRQQASEFTLPSNDTHEVVITTATAPRYHLWLPTKTGELYLCERQIHLDHLTNLRDSGGYQTASGQRVTYGKLFRSDALHELTTEEADYLQKQLQIHAIIDYRNAKEKAIAPDFPFKNMNTFALDPNAHMADVASRDDNNKKQLSTLDKLQDTKYHEQLKSLEQFMNQMFIDFVTQPKSIAVYREMFTIYLDEQNVAVLQHCKGGKDRTGFGTTLLLLALGVSIDDIIYEFMFSNIAMHQSIMEKIKTYKTYTQDEELLNNIYCMISSPQHFIETALQTIKNQYTTVENYLFTGLQLTAADITKLQQMYLEQ